MPGTEERGTGNRGTNSRFIQPKRITVHANRPLGYEDITTVGHVKGREIVDQLSIGWLSARELIDKARAKHIFLVEFSDQLVAGSREEIAEAQSDIATTLLKMKEEFQRRLSEDPRGINEFLGVAWPIGDPLAGLVTAAWPMDHADLWRSYLRPPSGHRRAARRKQRNEEHLGPASSRRHTRGKNPALDESNLDSHVQDIQRQELRRIRPLVDPNTWIDNLPKGIDILSALADLLGKSGVATGLSMAGILVSTFVDMGLAVEGQKRGARLQGYVRAWEYCITQVDMGMGKPELRISAVKVWSSMKRHPDNPIGRQLKMRSPASKETVIHQMQSGVIDAVNTVNSLMQRIESETRRMAKILELQRYGEEEMNRFYLKAIHRARVYAIQEARSYLRTKIPESVWPSYRYSY